MADKGSVVFDRRTVSIPADLAELVDSRVGPRRFSAYVAEALRHKIEQDDLDELLADWDISDDARRRALSDLEAALSEAR